MIEKVWDFYGINYIRNNGIKQSEYNSTLFAKIDLISYDKAIETGLGLANILYISQNLYSLFHCGTNYFKDIIDENEEKIGIVKTPCGCLYDVYIKQGESSTICIFKDETIYGKINIKNYKEND